MTNEKNSGTAGQRESTWERLKKTVFDLKVTVIELVGLIGFIIWICWYIYSTYKGVEEKLTKMENEMAKQSDSYRLSTEGLKNLFEQYDKRLDSVEDRLEKTQREVDSLRK